MTEKNANKGHSYLQKLQDKWKLKSLFQVLMVLIVFSLTGMTVGAGQATCFRLVWIYGSYAILAKGAHLHPLNIPDVSDSDTGLWGTFGSVFIFLGKEKKLFSFITKPFKSKKPTAN
jgi:hypothetical protein